MTTFHTATNHFLNDASIEGAGSTFTITSPISIVESDVGSPGKFSIVVSQYNKNSPATGHITYPGNTRQAYSVQRESPLCSGSHGIPGTKASPSVDGTNGIIIEPDVGHPLTFFKQFTAVKA